MTITDDTRQPAPGAPVNADAVRETVAAALAPTLAIPPRPDLDQMVSLLRGHLSQLLAQSAGALGEQDAQAVRGEAAALLDQTCERLTDFQLWERTRLVARVTGAVLTLHQESGTGR
ncbi:DUF6415 family natural product biosynthesis protein [Streptomyces sp. NPDC050439]|uniref:DUF6415 family natural product biosynthesis protein n=1 Tax=unclassified Streptomyces TaxID=2593676 RepID=UPI003444DE3D